MYFALVLLPDLPGVYGDIPSISDETMEFWYCEESDVDLLVKYFVDEASDLIGSLADKYEVDMYTAAQCKRLIPWLEEQIQRNDLPPRLIEIYTKLKEYSERAVALGTAVIIDM